MTIDPAAAYATGVAHRLALALATLVVDQTLLSESDVPFEPFTAAFAVDQRLTGELVSRRSSGSHRTAHREPQPGDELLRTGRRGGSGER